MTSALASPASYTFAPFGRRVSTLLLLLAIGATLQTTVLLTFNPQLAGWYPNHGHIYRDGLPVAHHHPWDVTNAHADGGAAPADTHPLCAVPGSPAQRDAQLISKPAVTFTPTPDALEAMTASLPVIGSPFVLPCDEPLDVGLAARGPAGVSTGVRPEVPTPPPRG